MPRVEHIFGVPVSVELREPTPAALAAVEVAFEWLGEAERRFGPFGAHSEVSGLARHSPVAKWLSQDLVQVMDLCATYEAASAGAFTAWPQGKPFDPGAVVTSWAAQRAGQILREAGVNGFCLRAGEDVLAVGGPECRHDWHVGVPHPLLHDRVCAVVPVADGAIATVGKYGRGIHILDGRTGRRPDGLLGITVVAEDLMTAGPVAAAAFAMGHEGFAWAATRPGCEVFAVDDGRRIHRSAGLCTLPWATEGLVDIRGTGK
jgi:thiamine biosynthesis lipoprotein